MPFFKITDQNGTQVIINTEYIIMIVSKDDSYTIHLTDNNEVGNISAETYEELKHELGIDQGFAYDEDEI